MYKEINVLGTSGDDIYYKSPKGPKSSSMELVQRIRHVLATKW